MNGYDIPKGTWVFTNRWGMHATSRYWTNPRKFDPTRFLKNGQVHKPDTFVPFGMGELLLPKYRGETLLRESFSLVEGALSYAVIHIFMHSYCSIKRAKKRLKQAS